MFKNSHICTMNRIINKIYRNHLVLVIHPIPLKNFTKIHSQLFELSCRQTDRQTDITDSENIIIASFDGSITEIQEVNSTYC